MSVKIPLRQCISCRNAFDKRTLIRLTVNTQGEISVDLTGKAQGRGAYICKNMSCLENAVKKGAFKRNFNVNPSEKLIDDLKNYISALNE